MTQRSVRLLSDLVAIPSVSGRGNLAIIARIEEEFARAGVACERFVLESDAALPEEQARWSLLARVGPAPGPERGGLLLSGHLDVVPANEPQWTGDPFTLRDMDGRLVGRGSADMKGFVALAVEAICAAAQEPLSHALMVLLTAEEEVGAIGARDVCRALHAGGRPPLPRRTIVGEPTSMQVVRMHLGHAKARFTISGRAAHSGSPHLGRNAIKPAGPLLVRLAALSDELESEELPTAGYFPDVPYVSLNIARIHGGDAFNVIPDRCEIDVGFRPLPGCDDRAIMARVRACTDGLRDVTFTDLGVNPALLLEEDDAFLGEMLDLLGLSEAHAAPYASDAGFLSRELGCSCVLWGPGSIEVAHRPDEWLSAAEWQRAGDELHRLIRHFCG